MIDIPALAGRAIFQIAFVVRDFDAALERYSATLGAGPWRCWTLGADDHDQTLYRGAPTDFKSRLALTDSFPQVELIQLPPGRVYPATHRAKRPPRLAREPRRRAAPHRNSRRLCSRDDHTNGSGWT